MEPLLHIIDRFTIHFAASTTLLLALAVGWRYLARKVKSAWFPKDMIQTLIYAGVSVLFIALTREYIDLARGQSLVKAISDAISWFTGIGFGIWGLYRWYFFKWE